MTMLQAALEWARNGYPVFPCTESKSPYTKNGFYDATTDIDQITIWWTEWPYALIAVRTGKESGLDVCDLDVKKGKNGFDHVPDWETRSNVIARTRTGGAHLYFKSDGTIYCTSDKIAKGVDTRGEGGYVIVPPTPGYRWVNGHDLSNLPPWPDDLRPPERDPNAAPNDELEAINPLEAEYAVAVIPNDDLGWDDWNYIGMAIHGAFAGNDKGREVFLEFSAKCPKYNYNATVKRWKGYDRSPPDRLGAGTLYHKATEADPNWRDKVHDYLGLRLQNGYEGTFAEYYQEISDTAKADKADDCSTDDSSTDQSEAAKTTKSHESKKTSRQKSEVGTLVISRVSDVESKKIDWLWKPRIARGKLTLLVGMPDVNKSTLTLDLASRVTRNGLLPNNEGRAPLGSVIILSAEDDVGDTIRPRLEVAGADLTRIHVITAIKMHKGARRNFDLSQDLEQLEKSIGEIGDVALIIIDPFSAYMGRPGKIDSYRSTDVRAVLAPLQEMAARHGTAVIGIGHLNKSGSAPAMLRVLDSVAFVAASRGVYLVVRDPDDDDRRLLLPVKNNIGKIRTGLAFKVIEKLAPPPVFDCYPAIKWEDEAVNMTADEALVLKQDGRKSEAAERAKVLINEMLASGARPMSEVHARAAKEDISVKSLRTAKEALNVTSDKIGTIWWWTLPGHERPM